MTANLITQDFLLYASREWPDATFWRNNRIKAKALGRDGHLRMIEAGIDGQADITGCVPVTVSGRRIGVRVEVEVKAGRDRQRDTQITFEHAINRAGGIYLIIHDAAKGVACLNLLLRDLER